MKKFKFNIQGKPYEVAINTMQNGIVDMDVNGKNFTVEIERERTVVTPPVQTEKPKLIEPKSTTAVKPVIAKDLPLSIMKVFVASGQTVKKGDKLFSMESNGKECTITADKDGEIHRIDVNIANNLLVEGDVIDLQNSTSISTSTKSNVNTDKAIPAPLPGTIVKVMLPEGTSVKVGDVVLTMDSMKMVNNVCADKDGKITAMLVKDGDAVLEGDPLFVIE